MDAEALLAGLDEEQRRAVTSDAQPLVILAPAGSGKTRVLTRRIAHRVATGAADARHVLAITFTRKAAGELVDRLRRLGLRDEATAGTFHGVAWGILRTRYSEQRRDAPALLDRKTRVLRDLVPTAPGRTSAQVAGEVAGEIEWAKARMVTPDTYVAAAKAAGRRPPLNAERVAELYAAYEREKQRRRVVDFEDLLALCARALEDDERFAAAQRWRFRHLFVDELQDVNPLQFRLLEAWRGDRYDVTAVGDPQQAIYGWNGADPAFLLDVHRWWPPAQVIQLVTSYRSSPEILDAAASVLRGARQPAQEVRAVRPTGEPPSMTAHPTDEAEAKAIARAVRLARIPGRPWADQAILVRTHAQTLLLAEALRQAGIPHRVRGGAALLERPEVRRALHELRAADVPLATALADLDGQIDARLDALRAVPEDELDERAASEAAVEAEVVAILGAVAQMGRDYLRLDPLGTPDTFVRWLHATVQSEGGPAAGGDAVDIATFHAAKGLEWAIVHLAGLEDGYVPIAHARTPAAKAEEARLLYVAMTRAQRSLHLTWAEARTFGSKVVERRRSPLLDPLVSRPPRPTVEPGGPLTPPTPAFAEEVAAQRAALATRQRAAVPGLQALHDWRDAAARAARVPPDAVLTDHVLARIASARPTSVEELADVRGVGTILAHRLGDEILRALHEAPTAPTP